MKIFMIGSSSVYDKMEPIRNELERMGHKVTNPNSYDNPNIEEEAWAMGFEAHAELDRILFKQSEDTIKNVDAVLCINLDKHDIKNYIGGATFIEIYEAFKNEKKIFLYHDIPEGILYDEIAGFNPKVINEDLTLIK